MKIEWSPIAIDPDSRVKIRTQIVEILKDVKRLDDVEHEIANGDEFFYEFNINFEQTRRELLLPYIHRYSSKYRMNEAPNTAYCFGRYLQGTFIVTEEEQVEINTGNPSIE
jgi:hypothetical protein